MCSWPFSVEVCLGTGEDHSEGEGFDEWTERDWSMNGFVVPTKEFMKLWEVVDGHC